MTHKEMSLKMASNLLKAIREIPTLEPSLERT